MSTAITNLRNRIDASKKAPGYNERMFVDAPTHELEAMLAERDELLAALRECVESLTTLKDVMDADNCVAWANSRDDAVDRARLAIARAEGKT